MVRICCAIMAVFWLPAFAQSRDDDLSVKVMEQAQIDYDDGKYQRVISSLEENLVYLDKTVMDDAYRYLILSHASNGNLTEAGRYLRMALKQNPKMTMAVPDSPIAVDLKELSMHVKTEIAREGACCSCFIPGWGQMIKGESGKGYAVLTGTALTVLSSAILWLVTDDRRDKYLALGPEDIVEMDEYYDSYNRWFRASMVSSGLLLGIYAYGFFDALSADRSDVITGRSDNTRKTIRIGYRVAL